eukprot:scaffold5049_cov161-Prasinococcus_capsulatus_cf.AAC.1
MACRRGRARAGDVLQLAIAGERALALINASSIMLAFPPRADPPRALLRPRSGGDDDDDDDGAAPTQAQ